MIYYAADWIFVGKGKPLPNTIVGMEPGGRISGVYPNGASRPDDGSPLIRLTGVLVPGFVNAHCHLELSHMKGRIPEGTGLPGFLEQVCKQPDIAESAKRSAREGAEREMIDSGVVAVGDISNGSDTFEQKATSELAYHTFVELLGWDPERARKAYEQGEALKREYEQVFAAFRRSPRVSISPHAPYTVSEKLFELMDHGANCDGMPMSLHHQESPGEDALFEQASGPMARFLDRVRGRGGTFRAHRVNSSRFAIPLLPRCHNVLLVHNTMSKRADLEHALRYSDRFFWVTCARANWYIERRLPDYDLWREMGLRICVGTDSLGSNWDLDLWNELVFIKERYSAVPFEELLQWATFNGAEALDMKHLGRIEEGARPGLVHLETDGSFALEAVRKVSPIDTRPA